MNWVRIENNLPDSPKIIKMARCMGTSENEALGVAVRWLCWLDRQTQHGGTQLLPEEVAEKVCQHPKAVQALQEVGWADTLHDGTVYSVDFELYNSPSAKARTLATARKAKSRLKKGGNNA